MKQRSLQTVEDLQKASRDLLSLEAHLPMVLTLTAGAKIRTAGQNSRYWADVAHFMQQINEAISQIQEHTGYTNLEVKRVVAAELPIEHAVILFASNTEVVHDVLKQICGIPTSTRLGTKEFMKFDETLAQTMTDIIGNINAVKREALA